MYFYFMRRVLASFLFILFSNVLLAQTDSTNAVDKPKPIKKEDKALKFNLNDDGSHFFQVLFLNQTWLRYNKSNPGTTLLGESASQTFDIGLRRTRIQMFGQVTDRAFVYFQF